MIRSVQEDHGRERRSLNLVNLAFLLSQDRVKRGDTIGLVRRKPIGQRGQHRRKRVHITRWDQRARPPIVFGLDQINRAPTCEIGVTQSKRLCGRRTIRTVQAPVAGDDVGPPISIQIRSVHSGPPARLFRESKLSRDFRKLARIVFENANRPPFARQNQFRKTVSIQITPNRAGDKSNGLKDTIVGRVNRPASVLIPKNHRRRGLWITPGKAPAPDEQIEIAVPVDVAKRERSRRRGLAGQIINERFRSEIELSHD